MMQMKARGGTGGGDRGREPSPTDPNGPGPTRCSCGQEKYHDAVCCQDCWNRNYYWEPPR